MKEFTKADIIEKLFFARWDDATCALSSSIVTLVDVQEEIRRFNAESSGKKMSTANPANFFKDFIRNQKRANANWPKLVFDKGYIGKQVTSSGSCFEFVPRLEGAERPFAYSVLEPRSDLQHFKIESVSLPLASKRLGRRDEPWLIQVLIRLRVFETHLALASSQKIVQLDHLQTNIKLRGSEIDALFLGIQEVDETTSQEVIICCEAKGKRDDIIPAQILNQVKAAFAMGIEQDVVIPLAVKAMASSQIYLVEFSPITRDKAKTIEALEIATSAMYHLVPPVKGIGQ